MASLIRNKRRTKLVTPSNSSFSNCVQDHLFIQPIRRPLETFKPVVYLDEQGRRHGRVSDHLLQQQIENDRQKLKKQILPNVSKSSSLYGIRNPNIAALIKDIPIDNDDDETEFDEDKIRADDEIKFIEYKKISKPATSKSNNRQISSISGKQSVKFDTTPSVNMARLVESHLTELDDIDNVDENDSESEGDEEDLESLKPVSDPDSNYRRQTDKSACELSGTLSTSKDNDDIRITNSSLDYNRPSQEMYMPPSVEDINDEEQKENESNNELLSPEIVQQQKRSSTPSEKIQERLKSSSSSSRPKTAVSAQSHSDNKYINNNEEPKSSRSSSSSSTSSDDTSALLRSDNDKSPTSSEDESNNEQEAIPIDTFVKLDRTSTNVSDTMNNIDEENVSTQTIEKLQQRDAKGEYDTSQVIQLKESFQPIINEAASYGHLDIVRKLIECGQSVHTQNMLQRTPLHEACVSGNGQLVSELLESGSLIDQRDSQGMTPLHVAASHGTIKCIRVLCEKGCEINAQDNLGQTAAHYSAMHNHIDSLKYLVNVYHIDLSISNNESKLPIHYAAKHGSTNVLNFLFQSNLTVYETDIHGNTIAHEASEYNQIDSIKLIWKMHRSLFKKKNHFGRTPIHTAALFGSSKVLHYLLELNIIDIDQTDNDGCTMAHLAASRGHGECFSCLIIHSAQLDIYTFDRHDSVMDVAKRSGKYGRIEKARSGTLRCNSCEEKLAKEKHDKAHARNAVEQLIHTQIQRGYNLNIPVNRSSTNLRSDKVDPPVSHSSHGQLPVSRSQILKEQIRVVSGCSINILSSIGIIFLNKYIFSHCHIKTMTLTAIQMAFTSIGLIICLQMNTFVRKKVSIITVLPLAISFCAFVVFTNLSLEYNTIGTYQLFKVLTTPVVALLSWYFYKIKYSRMVIITLIPVVIGVCTHSVNDIKLKLFGTIVASIGVISGSLYQVWICDHLKELEMNAQQLLFYQAPLSAILLVPFIFYMESFPSYATYEEQQAAVIAIIASGIAAFAVNLSVYWVIENTSTLTYNMIGHMKTVSILVGGYLIFKDSLNFKQLIGILLTLFGLFSYTFVKMSEQNQLPCKRWNANPTINIV
ncbi:unnamed protein product [Rotaria sp. Silwood1]|nr:unnamed protein product [Rotaria sp. Silwood1]